MNTTWLTRGASMLVLAAAALASTACANNEITAQSVRANPTPELETIAYTHEQRQNNLMKSWDTTGRQLIDDWDRFWLMDDPIRLSEYPIP